MFKCFLSEYNEKKSLSLFGPWIKEILKNYGEEQVNISIKQPGDKVQSSRNKSGESKDWYPV